MSITTEELLKRTRAALPDFEAESLHPIEKGGSSRRFFRIRSSDADSVILVHDLGEREENRQYAKLAEFLAARDVPVPGVLAEDHFKGLLWLEDLGEEDLWASRNEPWEVRRPLYESVLRGIIRLHRILPGSTRENGLNLQPGFDERLYRWEQEYFAEHCLGGIFGITQGERDELLRQPAMQQLARHLAEHPRQLIHRDFQSQNIMIRNGSAWLIDFQGMRPGLPQYDLASLLCDPYVEITSKELTHLLNFYRQLLAEEGEVPDENFELLFWQAAVQRLMQALGAYGFLSLHRGKPSFRSHVKPALQRLREALKQLPPNHRLDELAALVTNLSPQSLSQIQ